MLLKVVGSRMFVSLSLIPPMWIYVQYLTWLTGIIIMAAIVAMLAYPFHYKKVALLLGITGLSQVIISGFLYYPYHIFIVFPYEVACGLFALTSGVVIVTYSSIKKQVSRIVGLSFIVLGCFELIAIINNFLMIRVLIPSHVAFLISAPITITCGAIISFKSKVFLRSKISS
jgi:hypothetical protein